MLHSGRETTENSNSLGEKTSTAAGSRSWVSNLNMLKNPGKWVAHLYVNNSDYICCSYTESDQVEKSNEGKENVTPTNGNGKRRQLQQCCL